jgi:hypothetical protein
MTQIKKRSDYAMCATIRLVADVGEGNLSASI